MKPFYSEIDRIISDFVKLADGGIDPKEVEDWRGSTYRGIEEELQRDIEQDISTNIERIETTPSGSYRRVIYAEELRDAIADAEAFLRRLSEIIPDVEYLVSKGVGEKSYPTPMRASHIISFINEAGIDSILNGVVYEYGKVKSHGNVEKLIPLRPIIFHAKNIIRAKGHQLLTKELLAGKPSVADSIWYWKDNFSNEIEGYIDHLHNCVRVVKSIEEALIPIANMINFLQSKSYKLDDEGNKVTLEIELPEHLDFRIRSNFFNSADHLRTVYHILRSNAVEIVNHTRSKAGLKELKRIRKKPKDFLPLDSAYKELQAYIFKISRNRDEALAEILRVQSIMQSMTEGVFFYLMYNLVTGKSITDWYREYLYKDEEGKALRNFAESWRKIDKARNEVHQLFGSSYGLGGVTELIKQNGDYRNILKIVSAVANSLPIVHNFSSVIHNNPELKEEILEVCREGKGGIFKYEIVPKYFNAKSAIDRVERDRDNIEKADEAGIVNKREFFDALNKIKSLRLINIERSDYDDIKKASALFNTINNLKYIIKYEKRRHDKDPFLFNLDEEFKFEGKKIDFKVLRDRDPMHFFIGLETNCCQTIKEEGHQAVVDSYINPHAGVLVMYANNTIISQSYFHYVPEVTEEELAKLEKKRAKLDIKRKRYLLSPINRMEVSVYTHNILEKMGFQTIGDIAQLTNEQFADKIATFYDANPFLSRHRGRKAMKETIGDLKDHKLHLGITIENWPLDPVGLSEEEKERLVPTLVIKGAPLPPVEPLDNGVILDNVEAHPQRMERLGISKENLDELYAKYAKDIAKKLGLDYVKCGKENNKLDEDSFANVSMSRDPRKIMSEHKYSDFSKRDHLDLLSYTPEKAPADDYWADDVFASLHAMVHQFTKLAIS